MNSGMNKGGGKWPLLLIILIGVLTPLLSTTLFFAWRPAKQTNVGDILSPTAVQADWRDANNKAWAPAEWRGEWVLLMASAGVCDDACQRRLCRMYQLRLMLPGHYLRLRRVWVVTDEVVPVVSPQKAGCGEVADPILRERARLVDTLKGVELLFGETNALPAAASSYAAPDYLYLLDPAGVWTMRFSPDLNLYQIRKDIARLLKLSKGRKTVPTKE